jgi:endogenous inhibitor of DNA gyrase (YacG/DUF329 family)
MIEHKCPKCEKTTLLSTENNFRPFCSENCQNFDLGVWAQEKYTIPESHDKLQNAINNGNDEFLSDDDNIRL